MVLAQGLVLPSSRQQAYQRPIGGQSFRSYSTATLATSFVEQALAGTRRAPNPKPVYDVASSVVVRYLANSDRIVRTD